MSRTGRFSPFAAIRDDPEYGGYTCLKGRTLPESHNAEHRLHHSLTRGDDGEFRETPMPMALDHIASELRRIIDEHGPDSVAVFMGSGGYQNSAAWAASHSFARAVGSKHFFTSVTLDQPAKVFTTARYGKWEGGVNNFSDADVALFIGNNPIVSHYAPVGGVPALQPLAPHPRSQGGWHEADRRRSAAGRGSASSPISICR